MKKILWVGLILSISSISAAAENLREPETGFYVQLGPTIGVVTEGSGVPLVSLEAGIGYDIIEHLSVEVDGVLSGYSEPFDAESVELLGRGIFYMLGRKTFSPFVGVAVGGGHFQDERDIDSESQFIIGMDAGVSWSFAVHHGLYLRLSDLFHHTTSVDGNLNVIQSTIQYRYTF